MRIHLGGDHAAYELQRELVTWLGQEGHEVIDHGPTGYDELDDYPVFVLRAAEGVANDDGSLGIVLGGQLTKVVSPARARTLAMALAGLGALGALIRGTWQVLGG